MKGKLLAILVGISMIFSMTGCGNSGNVKEENVVQNNTQSETENSSEESGSEPITIKGWGAFTFDEQSGITSYNEQLIWKEVENRLNIKVDWTTVPAADKSTLFSLAMSDSGNLPDFIVDMSPLIYEEFGRAGALIALNDYITPEKMPNLYGLLEEYPDARASITSADGNIYFFPRIMEVATRYWSGWFIREDFLEEAGLLLIPAMEITTAEEVHVLSLFPSVEAALEMGEEVYAALPPVRNKPDIFGYQRILDENDEPVGELEKLLINAAMLPIDAVFEKVRGYGGVPIPAHIDKSANSVLANLGVIPPELEAKTVEISPRGIDRGFAPPDGEEYFVITDSDAHDLETMSGHEARALELEEISVGAILKQLGGLE